MCTSAVPWKQHTCIEKMMLVRLQGTDGQRPPLSPTEKRYFASASFPQQNIRLWWGSTAVVNAWFFIRYVYGESAVTDVMTSVWLRTMQRAWLTQRAWNCGYEQRTLWREHRGLRPLRAVPELRIMSDGKIGAKFWEVIFLSVPTSCNENLMRPLLPLAVPLEPLMSCTVPKDAITVGPPVPDASHRATGPGCQDG